MAVGFNSFLDFIGYPIGVSTTSINDNLNLFISGPITINDNCDITINGHNTKTDNINLFISTLGNSSEFLDLFIKVPEPISKNLNLFIYNKDFIDKNIDLLIIAKDNINNNLNLFVGGKDPVIANLELFIFSVVFIENNFDLFVSGSANSVVENIPLIIKGSSPSPQISCPALDPTASIQISDDLIQIYQSRIDALINQLGKNVLLIFDPIIEPCPNCQQDIISHRSTGIYKPGGPISFPRGQKCPYCKGQGFLERENAKCAKCLIKWNAKEALNYNISVEKSNGIVRLKAFLSDAPDLIKCKYIIVNHDIEGILKLRARLIQGPVPVGLRFDRYCISFWEIF